MAASSPAQISEGERLKARARAQGGKARVMVQGQMPTAPLEMVASEADLIVQGRISAVEPRFLDAEGMVVTYFTVTPTRTYKNAVGAGTARTPSVTAPIIFVVPGGTVSVEGLEISYVMENFVPDPPLQIGEEIIAFLKRKPDSNEFLLHSRLRLGGAMANILTSVLLGSLVSTPTVPQCVTIPEAVELLRPQPVERYRTLEIVDVPLEKVVGSAHLIVEGTVHPIRTYLAADKCALYTDYAVDVSAVHRGAIPKPTRPGEQGLVITLWGGETVINGSKVTVLDYQLPLLPDGERVLLLLQKARVENRDVYRPAFETLGAFKLTHNSLTHLHGFGGPLYNVDKPTLLGMIGK